MISKKFYCDICDKYISNKSSHNKTKLHTHLSLSVVNKCYIVDIPVGEIDNIINKHICEYNKKFLNFVCWCKIQNGYLCEKFNLGWINAPDIKIQKEIKNRRDFKQNDFVYMEIWFVTDPESSSYNHFFQLPKPMIERKMCQIIDHNPNLIKI